MSQVRVNVSIQTIVYIFLKCAVQLIIADNFCPPSLELQLELVCK